MAKFLQLFHHFFRLEYYVRLLSICYFMGFFLHLLDVLGLRLSLGDMPFWGQVWVVYLLLADLFAAIFLWKGHLYGHLAFLFVATSQFIVYTLFIDFFGPQVPLILFHLTTVILYLILLRKLAQSLKETHDSH